MPIMLPVHGHPMAGLSVDVKLRTSDVNPTELQQTQPCRAGQPGSLKLLNKFESMKVEPVLRVNKSIFKCMIWIWIN